VTTSFASRISELGALRATLVCLIPLVATLLLDAPRGSAEEAAPAEQAAQLRLRFERLTAREDAVYVEGAIEQARQALEVAESADGEPERRERAIETARAALVLGERQLHRREVQSELIATQRRLTAIRERAAAQRRVLEALMRERASLARAGEQP
jgi:hypothetical protein